MRPFLNSNEAFNFQKYRLSIGRKHLPMRDLIAVTNSDMSELAISNFNFSFILLCKILDS